MLKKLALRMILRAVKRRSPKADLLGGSAIAAVITGLMLAVGVPAEAAAMLGANLGAIGATVANLIWGDDVTSDDVDDKAQNVPTVGAR